jgi:putative DNA primase/helicase
VKWLTGNDELTGRNPHDKYEVSFKPTHTLFLLTNNKPHAPAEDFAFWQRVLLIPFNLSFVTREPEQEHERRADIYLADKLKEESSGILAWLVRGCLEWQEQKGLHPPQKVKAATADYKMDEDNIAAFVDTCCITGGIDIWSGATALYEAFEAWWKKYVSNFPMKQKKFGALMRKKFTSEKVGGVYRYYGVALTEENQDD